MDGADVEIPVICGPTAAGKSAIALWIAARVPVTIVSADSRQVYRGLDIGTAKPDREARARVPHDGIDVVSPANRYSAAAWATAADEWIGAARADGRVPLVVGGTGLYLRALFDGLFEEPPLDPVRRAALARWLSAFDTDELRRWVVALDPPRSHLGRTQLLRALEIALLTGLRVSTLHRDRASRFRWRPRYLVVDSGPTLAHRIAARIDEMLDNGWPDEVQRLMHTIPADAPAWNATGYDTVRRLVSGGVTRAAAREEILIATRQYAKRQRTWFRHQLSREPSPAPTIAYVDPTVIGWESIVEHWMGAVGPGGSSA